MTDVELHVLQVTVASGFKELHRRLDEHQEGETQHHQQVLTRLDLINGRVSRAHERLGVLEALHKALDRTVDAAKRRMHELAGKIQGGPESDEAKHITRGDLRWIVIIATAAAGAGAGLTLWIVRLAGGLGG